MNKKVLTVLVFLIFFIIGGVTFYFFGQDLLHQWFGPKDTNVPGGVISKNEPLAKCIPGDKSCEGKNNRILANRLEGVPAKFVSHQCDGPRACPTPTDEQDKVIKAAIKAYAKDQNLNLIPINGITPAGMAYYCAQDNRCWSYDTKMKKVEFLSEDSPTASSSGTNQ